MGATKESVEKDYAEFLAARCRGRTSLTAAELVDAVLEFYQSVRVDGCVLEEDGDMLLFQWGTYDWGKGKHFSFGVTRQIIWTDEEGEQEMRKLMHELRLPPDGALAALERGDQWCDSPSPRTLKKFRAFIEKSPAFKALADVAAPASVSFTAV